MSLKGSIINYLTYPFFIISGPPADPNEPKTVISSGDYYHTYTVANVLDGNNYTTYISRDNKPPNWLQVTFLTPKMVKSVYAVGRVGYARNIDIETRVGMETHVTEGVKQVQKSFWHFEFGAISSHIIKNSSHVFQFD